MPVPPAVRKLLLAAAAAAVVRLLVQYLRRLRRRALAAPRGPTDVDVVVVGAGFSGLYLIHKLRSMGLSVRCLEAATDVGGTWYWNRYPGAMCDVESVQYCYSWCPELLQEWHWKMRYGTQKEIQGYLRHVAERFDLLRDIQFRARVAAATWDEAGSSWSVEVEGGRGVSARYLVMATGCLSKPNIPQVPGRELFRGRTFHTYDWPEGGVDFAGRKVAVIGAGSSSVQVTPQLAQQAGQLYVFVRTPPYVLPARNAPIDPPFERVVKQNYANFLAKAHGTPGGADFNSNAQMTEDATDDEREAEYQRRWDEGGFTFLGSYADIIVNEDSSRKATDFIRARIRDTVRDPAVAEALCPQHALNCKRPCVGHYYEAFNRSNVTLVTLPDAGIEGLSAGGVLAGGKETQVDDIVFATGFDAMTGALGAIKITGRDGRTLREHWAQGPRTYLGLSAHGFPNLLTITGPQSPSVLTNMVAAIEQHVDWVANFFAWMGKQGHTTFEATEAEQDEWVKHNNEVGEMTVIGAPKCGKVRSWYQGANIPGKPTGMVYPYCGGLDAYRTKCDEVAKDGYTGLTVR